MLLEVGGERESLLPLISKRGREFIATVKKLKLVKKCKVLSLLDFSLF